MNEWWIVKASHWLLTWDGWMDGWMDATGIMLPAMLAQHATGRTACVQCVRASARYKAELYHNIQDTCLWSCPEDTVHGGRLFPSLLTVFKVWRCRFSQFYRLLHNTFTRSAVKPACFGGLCLCSKSIPQARTIYLFIFVFSQSTEENKPRIQPKFLILSNSNSKFALVLCKSSQDD